VSVVANVAINVDATKALGQLKAVDQASKGLDSGLKGAAVGAKGFGAALQAALGPLLAVSTAVATVQKGLSVAFERGAAEQRLKNLSSSTGEYQAALAAAASTSEKFGISQTEATTALADVYGRLKGVGFGLKETTEIYEGFNVVAKQSGISGADAAGVFFQLSQALGKGKLNGDEFVSVSERMPGLLDAIAKETGRSRGELAGMAEQGEITSEVLYRALAQSAGAAGDLNAKLTDQQKAFNNLGRVTDSLLNTIGQVFAPFVIKGAELLAAAGQKLSEWWDYLGKNVLPQVLQALQPAIAAFQNLWNQIPWDTIVGYIQGAILVGIQRIVKAVEFLSPIIGFVVTKFAELAQNPVFKFIAEQVGRLLNHLGISNQEVSKFAAGQKEVEKATAGTVGQYSSMPEKINNAKGAAKELKEQQQAVTDAIKESGVAIDANARESELIANQQSSIKQAYLQAEMQINDVLLDQLNRQLDGAKTQAQRVAVARDIYQLTVQQAKLEYEATRAQIAAEVEKAHLALMATEQKAKQVQIIVEIARAEGRVNESHYKSLQLANESVNLASIQAGTTRLIATQQERAAKATLQGKINAAGAAFETNILAKNTSDAANQSERFAAGFQKAAAAASGMSQNALTKKIYGATTTTTTRANVASAATSSSANYIVPESGAASFTSNYLSGERGAVTMPGGGGAAPTISIQTGPVVQMNGQNYVTTQDMSRAVQAGVQQTLNMMRNDRGTRRAVGLA